MLASSTLPKLITATPKIAKPFLKWAGGKGQLIEKLAAFFPPEMQQAQIHKYIEPFVGGGALFFYVAQHYPSIETFFISDINAELILAYQTIQKQVEELIVLLEQFEQTYHALEQHKRKAFYYQKRTEFNQQLASINFQRFQKNWLERTATLIFLNKTCFNGLFRVNSKGAFNVPFGDYRNPRICDSENLCVVSRILQNTLIKCGNFTMSKPVIDKHTLVYFDPPYRPISKTANFTAYTQFDFDESAQQRLASYFEQLSQTGAKLMLSNSDPRNENREDYFFEDLYKKFRIERVDASRLINCNGNNRGKIKELVVLNY